MNYKNVCQWWEGALPGSWMYCCVIVRQVWLLVCLLIAMRTVLLPLIFILLASHFLLALPSPEVRWYNIISISATPCPLWAFFRPHLGLESRKGSVVYLYDVDINRKGPERKVAKVVLFKQNARGRTWNQLTI